MAHCIENMLYVGQAPWHGLGVALDNPPAVAEAIRLAGLDWTVDLRPCVAQLPGSLWGDEQDRFFGTDHFATIRMVADIPRVLGVVGPNYRPLQNSEAFAFFQPFLDTGGATIETAGSLCHGRRVWIL